MTAFKASIFKKISLILCFSSILPICFGCKVIAEEHTARGLVEKCKTLKLGMNKTDVIKIMGEPIRIDTHEQKGTNKEWLHFKSPKMASTFIKCVVDIKTGLVEEIVCDDTYRITTP